MINIQKFLIGIIGVNDRKAVEMFKAAVRDVVDEERAKQIKRPTTHSQEEEFAEDQRELDTVTPGVFVPERLIKDFARATENAWIDGDFKDCYHEVENFLKAIDKEGGQNE